jgi:hypothetical protein
MADQISHEHHYVPRWYQKRFLAPGEEKLWYLDLKPEKVVIDRGRSYTKQALFRSYPAHASGFRTCTCCGSGKPSMT